MPLRRRRALRRTPRSNRLRRFGVVGLVLGLIAIALGVIVVRQYLGYFGGHKPPKHVAVVPSASPSVVPTPIASAPIESPSPTASASPTGPQIAIIIDDCGYSIPRDVRFLKLAVPITLSILPLTPHGKAVAAAAEAAGKSVMLHIPMEPESSTANPGPGAIRTEMTDAQIDDQLTADIASLPPVPGANNHMGSKASSDTRVMRDVIGVLKHDNMFFIDSMTAMTSVGEQTAHDLGVPTAARDVFLDDRTTVPYIEGQIRQLEIVARKNGSAIAIGHPFDATAAALEAMVPQMQAAGFVFVTAQSLTK